MDRGLTVVENGLVPVYETSTGENVVFGTELHKILKTGTRYNDWIQRRLKECEAIEMEDYEGFTQNQVNHKGGRPKHEYILKLDIAKEMAMLERNEKGKQVRRYFIQIEKKYKMVQKAAQEKLAAFMERQEEFNQAVMKKLGSLESNGNGRAPGNLFFLLGSILEERMKVLNSLVDQVSDLCGLEINRVLHFM